VYDPGGKENRILLGIRIKRKINQKKKVREGKREGVKKSWIRAGGWMSLVLKSDKKCSSGDQTASLIGVKEKKTANTGGKRLEKHRSEGPEGHKTEVSNIGLTRNFERSHLNRSKGGRRGRIHAEKKRKMSERTKRE